MSGETISGELTLEDDKLSNSESQQEYFTVKQLSVYSKIGTKYLYNLIQMDSFPYLKLGSKIVVRRSDFDNWFDKRKNSDALIPKIRIRGSSKNSFSKQ